MKKYNMVKFGKILAAVVALTAGMAIGGNVLYKDGMVDGGNQILGAVRKVDPEIDEKLYDVYTDEDEEESKED